MDLTEHSFGELSNIEVRYFTVPTSKRNGKILVIRYQGRYRDGGDGDSDAQYMRAMAEAGIEAFGGHSGVIHDLTDLNYSWGDMLPTVFSVGPRFGSRQAGVVVGPKCEEAVRTVILGLQSTDRIERIGYIFRNLDDAWSYVDSQIK